MTVPQATFGEPEPGLDYTVRPCAYGIAVRRRSVLLVKGANGGWFLPGGGLERGERSERGLIREIQEELGCAAAIRPAFAYAKQYVYSIAEDTHFELHASFHSAFLENFTTSRGEHSSEWVNIDHAQSLLQRPADSWALRLYVESSKSE